MYPTHDRSNPDVIRPKTKGGLRFRPIDYWDGDVEGGSRPVTIMAPGGHMPSKGHVKYSTPPVGFPLPAQDYDETLPRFASVCIIPNVHLGVAAYRCIISARSTESLSSYTIPVCESCVWRVETTRDRGQV